MSVSQAIDQPLYGARPIDAVARFWRKYLVLAGRASRSEFWWWMLFFIVVSGLLSLLDRALVHPLGPSPDRAAIVRYSIETGVLSTAWSLVNLIGGITLTVRRLHDTNRTGWWWFVQLIPAVGTIAMIVLVALPTDPAGVRFDTRAGDES